MRVDKAGYGTYVAARSALKATRLIGLFRPYVSSKAARLIFRLSGNGRRPVNVKGHKMLLAPPGGYVAPDLLAERYEPETTRLFERLVKPGQTVIDLGAHVGYYALLAARCVGPTGRVYAFEPEPQNFALLLTNIQLNNYDNIIPVRKAVTKRDGSAELFLNRQDSGMHSLFHLHLRNQPNPRRISVDATTLDTFLEQEGWPRVDLIKIDVEGSELSALDGMKRCLKQTHQLIIEFCPWILLTLGIEPAKFIDKLLGLGFRIAVIVRDGILPLEQARLDALVSRLLGKDGYANLLCTRP